MIILNVYQNQKKSKLQEMKQKITYFCVQYHHMVYHSFIEETKTKKREKTKKNCKLQKMNQKTKTLNQKNEIKID